MTNNLEDEIRTIVTNLDSGEQQSQRQTQQEQDTNTQTSQDAIQDVYVLIVREQEEEQVQVVESTPVPPQNVSFLPAYALSSLYILLILSTLVFQCYCMVNPLVATITIIPTSQTETVSGTVQLGRVLNPITISQSLTTPATGHGHQDARAATGYLTFYNGQFQSVTIAAGTILTGTSSIQIVTDQDAIIPAGNPPSYGQVSLSAHAMNAGVSGDIPSYDINQACCATSVLVKNTQPFYGGQDERTYTTVTQKDIHSVSTVLKTTLAQSITGAFQGQLKPNEQLQLLPCTPMVTSDHPIGAEATQVNVTVSETCSAVAYNSQQLQTKATEYLAAQARYKTGAGYSLFGTVHVAVTQATVNSITPHLVFLSFNATGTWIYGLSNAAQQHIKALIVGKTTQQAGQLLISLLGIEHASIRLSGFGDATQLPKLSKNIHLTIIVV